MPFEAGRQALYVCACVRPSVRARARPCLRARVRACVCVRAHTHTCVCLTFCYQLKVPAHVLTRTHARTCARTHTHRQESVVDGQTGFLCESDPDEFAQAMLRLLKVCALRMDGLLQWEYVRLEWRSKFVLSSLLTNVMIE